MVKRIRPRQLSARINFRRLSEATSHELLVRYERLVLSVAASRAAMSTGCGRDDLVSIGQIAVLEAHLTYRATMDCSRASWTRRVVRWRIVEEATRYHELPLGGADDAERLLDDLAPDEQYARAFAREAIGKLDPRRAVILQCRLHGWTCEEVGVQLGISTQLVNREEHKALRQLQAWAAEKNIKE